MFAIAYQQWFTLTSTLQFSRRLLRGAPSKDSIIAVSARSRCPRTVYLSLCSWVSGTGNRAAEISSVQSGCVPVIADCTRVFELYSKSAGRFDLRSRKPELRAMGSPLRLQLARSGYPFIAAPGAPTGKTFSELDPDPLSDAAAGENG